MRSAGVVLAARSARRVGEAQQPLRVDGRPLLEGVLASVNASRLDEVVVVLGARADAIEAEVDFGRARVVRNPDFAIGMSTSLRAGLAALGPDVDRAMVVLGDQPAISG